MVGRVFLGRYQVISLLGEGGMGKVYLARQLDLDRQVVVKVMHDHVAADPKFCDRFQRETLLMARFQHSYAVTLYDASLNDPQGPCIVMEYIRGTPLDQLMEKNGGRLSPARAGRLLGQLCEVLQAAHKAGIVHRDLKPANLMVLDADTPYEKIKVMDFGLAKLLDPPNYKQVSVTGMDFAVGTPAYICPEQVRGEPMDHRGDIYSVGVLIYEMLTGRTPFSGNSSMDILLAHATENPPSFADVGAADVVPPAVEKVVQSCLAKDPAQRPASARDLAEFYERALAGDEIAKKAKKVEPPTTEVMPSPLPNLLPKNDDPNSVTFQLAAWMPEAIAAHKLKGFVYDAKGEVVESVPGRIRVRLGGPGSKYQFKPKRRSWLAIGRRSGLIEMDLHMVQAAPNQASQLFMTVQMRSVDGVPGNDDSLRDFCSRIFVSLRGYLMAQTIGAEESNS
jgi:eukaryotic-like serine/threonine-protein kinase